MRFSYQQVRLAPDRDEVILEHCRGRRVLHVGACDSPFTSEKLQQGLLLHQRLARVAGELVGIDLDRDAIDFLARQGLTGIHYADMNEELPFKFEPEVIVFGETLEHLDNLGVCLTSLRRQMSSNTLLIISTPNCYAIVWPVMVLLNFESIHDDHKVGFSYGLLHQLLTAHGLRITQGYFTYLPRARLPWWRRVWRLAGRLRRGFAETLLVVAERVDVHP